MHTVIFFICAITESCNLIFKKWNKEGPTTSHFYEVFSSGVYGLLGVARWRSSRISWTASCGFKCLYMCRLKSLVTSPSSKHRDCTAAPRHRGEQCFSLHLCLSREERTKITPGFLTDPLQSVFFLACMKWHRCLKPCKWVLAPMDSYFILVIYSVSKESWEAIWFNQRSNFLINLCLSHMGWDEDGKLLSWSERAMPAVGF